MFTVSYTEHTSTTSSTHAHGHNPDAYIYYTMVTLKVTHPMYKSHLLLYPPYSCSPRVPNACTPIHVSPGPCPHRVTRCPVPPMHRVTRCPVSASLHPTAPCTMPAEETGCSIARDALSCPIDHGGLDVFTGKAPWAAVKVCLVLMGRHCLHWQCLSVGHNR